jgi:hypothetical protein
VVLALYICMSIIGYGQFVYKPSIVSRDTVWANVVCLGEPKFTLLTLLQAIYLFKLHNAERLK